MKREVGSHGSNTWVLERLRIMTAWVRDLKKEELFRLQRPISVFVRCLRKDRDNSYDDGVSRLINQINSRMRKIPHFQINFRHFSSLLRKDNREIKSVQLKVDEPRLEHERFASAKLPIDNIIRYLERDVKQDCKPIRRDQKKISELIQQWARGETLGFSSSRCLSCITNLVINWMFHSGNHNNIYRLHQFEAINNLNSILCAAANQGLGYIFEGIREDDLIEGIVLSAEEKQGYVNLVTSAIETIQPALEKDQYSIGFINVVEDPYLQFQESTENRYVVRICIKPKKLQQYRIRVENQQKGRPDKYYFIDEKFQSIFGEDIYQKMLQKNQQSPQYQLLSSLHYQVPCQAADELVSSRKKKIEEEQLQSEKKKERQSKKFGKHPCLKSKLNTAVFVIKGDQIRQLDDLTMRLKEQKYECYLEEIYEKIESDSNRKIFVLNSSIRFPELKNFIGKSKLCMLEVKQCLVLKEQRQLREAFKQIGTVFDKNKVFYFKQWVKANNDCNTQVEKFFFRFESIEQSLFAFALLEAKRIKTNFVSLQKSLNVQLFYIESF